MFEKIKQYLPELIGKIKTSLSSIPAPVKWVALLYFALVSAVLLLFLGLFCYEYTLGKTKSADLLPFINVIVGSSFVGFVTFLLGLVIDTNGNQIPLLFDKDEKK